MTDGFWERCVLLSCPFPLSNFKSDQQSKEDNLSMHSICQNLIRCQQLLNQNQQNHIESMQLSLAMCQKGIAYLQMKQGQCAPQISSKWLNKTGTMCPPRSQQSLTNETLFDLPEIKQSQPMISWWWLLWIFANSVVISLYTISMTPDNTLGLCCSGFLVLLKVIHSPAWLTASPMIPDKQQLWLPQIINASLETIKIKTTTG